MAKYLRTSSITAELEILIRLFPSGSDSGVNE